MEENKTNIIQKYINAWKNWKDFKGRSSRSDFFSFFLIHIIVSILLNQVDIIGNIYTTLALVPITSLSFRRLHDVNKSGLWIIPSIAWFSIVMIGALITSSLYTGNMNPFMTMALLSKFALLGFLVFYGALPALIFAIISFIFVCKKGDEGDNKYGKTAQ